LTREKAGHAPAFSLAGDLLAVLFPLKPAGVLSR